MSALDFCRGLSTTGAGGGEVEEKKKKKKPFGFRKAKG